MPDEIFVNTHYYDRGKCNPKSADIVCPFCGTGFDIENLKHWEDELDSEIGDVRCPECDRNIIFEKSTKITYTPIAPSDKK